MPTLSAGKDRVQIDSVPAFEHRSTVNSALILNMFYSGLGIARDLAGRGIRVIGLSADRGIYGNFTRSCEVRNAPNSQEEPEKLLETLLQLSDEVRGAVIFPTRDADVLFLDRFRDELAPYFTLAIPAHDCLMQVMDKHALSIAAQRAGVPVPRTVRVSSRSDLHRVEREVGYPCVVKPVFAVTWRGAESWKKVGARKAIRVENEDQLEREYESLSWVGGELLVQQWISGPADQIVIFGGHFRRGGEVTQFFTARKLVQSPDEFGTGCVVESVEIPEIVSLSKRLCRFLQYEGVAEIEYKYDASSRKFCLIEINTRHWDWHRLGNASGINLSWAAYCDLTGRPLDHQPRKIASAKWIAEDALFVYAIRALYNRQVSLSELWRKLSGRRVYGVSSWRDPLPGLRYFFLIFLPQVAKSIVGNFRGGQAK